MLSIAQTPTHKSKAPRENPKRCADRVFPVRPLFMRPAVARVKRRRGNVLESLGSKAGMRLGQQASAGGAR